MSAFFISIHSLIQKQILAPLKSKAINVELTVPKQWGKDLGETKEFQKGFKGARDTWLNYL